MQGDRNDAGTDMSFHLKGQSLDAQAFAFTQAFAFRVRSCDLTFLMLQ